MAEFTKDYYSALLVFSPRLHLVAKSLAEDKAIAERIKGSLSASTPHDTIIYCVLYDLSQIVKILSDGNVSPTSLQTIGAVLLSSKLTNQQKDFFSYDYETLAKIHEGTGFTAAAANIIGLSKGKKPLEISVQRKDSAGATSDTTISGTLCLPAFLKILEHPLFDEYATTLYRFAVIIAKADGSVSRSEEGTLREIYQATHKPLPGDVNKSLRWTEIDEKETLDDVMNELDDLIGLKAVKEEVRSLTNYIRVQKERQKLGLKCSPVSYHCVFIGSPGTGKTTIARILSRIYRHLGVLKKGHLVETDRSGLVAEYLGQTAIKVNKTIDSALDGVLFVDEAYSLIGENRDDYGKEAVATMIKRIEDDRDKLAVILAGYPDEMRVFINTNPGFKSRFNRYIEFADYSPNELEAIFLLQCKKSEYALTEDAQAKVFSILEQAYAKRDRTFGNGRYARNLFEKVVEQQANRIAGVSQITKEVLTTIILEDVPDKPN